MTAYELVAEVPWSLTLDEDAVFAVLPEVRRTLVRNAAEVIDDVLLNADRTATNGINADGGTLQTSTAGKAHFLIGFDGLVHLPLVDNTGQSVSQADEISSAAYLNLLKKLGKYGLSQSETVFVTDVATFTSELGFGLGRDGGQAGSEGDDPERTAGVDLRSSVGREWPNASCGRGRQGDERRQHV